MTNLSQLLYLVVKMSCNGYNVRCCYVAELKINENSTIDVIRSQRTCRLYDCIPRAIFAPQTISFVMFDVATNFNIGSKNCMLVLVAAAGAY